MRHSTSPTGLPDDGPCSDRFDQTQWSVVLAAAGRRHANRTADSLEQLCRLYWRPLYAFIRRRGASPHDAQDLTQEFFFRLLHKDYLRSVDPAKGRFRSFLLGAVKHFLANEHDRAHALKRGGGQVFLPLDFTAEEGRPGFHPADPSTPESLFERSWATILLEQTLARLRQEFAAEGKEALFEGLKNTLTDGREGAAYAELATSLNLSEAAVKMAVHRLRRRYRACLRAEIARTVASPEEVDDELRQVMGIFAR